MLEVIQCCHDHGDHLDLLAMIVLLHWARRNKLHVGESVAPLAKSMPWPWRTFRSIKGQ